MLWYHFLICKAFSEHAMKTQLLIITVSKLHSHNLCLIVETCLLWWPLTSKESVSIGNIQGTDAQLRIIKPLGVKTTASLYIGQFR